MGGRVRGCHNLDVNDYTDRVRAHTQRTHTHARTETETPTPQPPPTPAHFTILLALVGFTRVAAYWSSRSSVLLLTAEAVQSAPLPLQGVHDVHGGDGLPLGVLRVSDGVADHVLEEHLQHSASLLVYQAGYTFDAAPAGETTDRRLRDALDVIAQHFPVTLRSTFPQTLSTFTATGHVDYKLVLLHASDGETFDYERTVDTCDTNEGFHPTLYAFAFGCCRLHSSVVGGGGKSTIYNNNKE